MSVLNMGDRISPFFHIILVHREKDVLRVLCCSSPTLNWYRVTYAIGWNSFRPSKIGSSIYFYPFPHEFIKFSIVGLRINLSVAQHNILIKKQKEKQFLLITRIWISISPILLLHPQPVIIISILMMCVNKVRNGKVSIMPYRFYDY